MPNRAAIINDPIIASPVSRNPSGLRETRATWLLKSLFEQKLILNSQGALRMLMKYQGFINTKMNEEGR
ncbi:hypothetical protein [Syntrophomonas wolfei]|uniref:hypothetical protein n=1 Tax=Syntrophomonas wolfei TaxID=863 RepID=UPI0002EE3782|nr:hypothetical protein [Syntrophomonas wolfei]